MSVVNSQYEKKIPTSKINSLDTWLNLIVPRTFYTDIKVGMSENVVDF